MVISAEDIAFINSYYEKHNVEKLYLFGSALGKHFTEKSDFDFLVKFKIADISKYFDNYLSFKTELKSLLQRDVCLVEEQALRNPILINSINKNKQLIYG